MARPRRQKKPKQAKVIAMRPRTVVVAWPGHTSNGDHEDMVRSVSCAEIKTALQYVVDRCKPLAKIVVVWTAFSGLV